MDLSRRIAVEPVGHSAFLVTLIHLHAAIPDLAGFHSARGSPWLREGHYRMRPDGLEARLRQTQHSSRRRHAPDEPMYLRFLAAPASPLSARHDAGLVRDEPEMRRADEDLRQSAARR